MISNYRLLELARIAATAAGLPESDVETVEGAQEGLPAVEIGEVRVALADVSDTEHADYSWLVNDNYYDPLAEALAEAVSEECFQRAYSELIEAGLDEEATMPEEESKDE